MNDKQLAAIGATINELRTISNGAKWLLEQMQTNTVYDYNARLNLVNSFDESARLSISMLQNMTGIIERATCLSHLEQARQIIREALLNALHMQHISHTHGRHIGEIRRKAAVDIATQLREAEQAIAKALHP